MKHLVLYLICAVGTQSLCCADVTKLSQTIARSCKIPRVFMRFIPPVIYHPQSSRFAATSSQNLAGIGTRLMPLQIQPFLQNG